MCYVILTVIRSKDLEDEFELPVLSDVIKPNDLSKIRSIQGPNLYKVLDTSTAVDSMKFSRTLEKAKTFKTQALAEFNKKYIRSGLPTVVSLEIAEKMLGKLQYKITSINGEISYVEKELIRKSPQNE